MTSHLLKKIQTLKHRLLLLIQDQLQNNKHGHQQQLQHLQQLHELPRAVELLMRAQFPPTMNHLVHQGEEEG